MTELDIVNDCLATMGISPLNQLDDNNPDVANCRRIIKTYSEDIQSRGWWFNNERVKLFPDTLEGYIYVPNDCISVRPIMRHPLLPITQRGNRLYDNDIGNEDYGNGFIFDKPVTCWYIRNVPFKELPPTAKRTIGLASVRKFQQSFDADPQKMGRLDQEYGSAYMMLVAEHTRMENANMLRRNSTLRDLAAINGSSGRRW